MNDGLYLNLKENRAKSNYILKGLFSGCSLILMLVLILHFFSISFHVVLTLISALLIFSVMYILSVKLGKSASLFVTAAVLLVIIFCFSDFVNGFYQTVNSILKIYSNKNAEIISLISTKNSNPLIFLAGLFTLLSTLKILLDSKIFNCILMLFSLAVVIYFGCDLPALCVAYFLCSAAEIFFIGGNIKSFAITTAIIFAVTLTLSAFDFDNVVSNLSFVKTAKDKISNGLTETEIELVMEKPQPIYLIENAEKPQCSLYNFSDDFYWLYKNNFFPQRQSAMIPNLTESTNESEITINVKQGKKRIFSTYGIIKSNSLSDDTKSIDGKFNNDSKNGTYSFTINNNFISKQNQEYNALQKNINNKDTNRYLLNEQVYRNYCHKTYTSISSSQRQLIENHLENSVLENKNITEIKKSILSYFQNNVSYDSNKSDDFSITDMLEKSCLGNEYDYAKLTEIFFRFYNVPARICKGYMVKPQMTNSLSEYSAVTITKNNLHTWCEYYLDGIGWLPFETCPDYVGMIKTDDAFYSENSSDNSLEKSENKKVQKEQTVENEKTAEDAKDKNNCLPYLIILIPFLLLISTAIFQRAKVKSRLSKIKKQSNRQQVKNYFVWAFSLLQNLCPNKNNAPDEYKKILEKSFGKPFSECYEKAEKTYEKVLFSQLNISENELDDVTEFFNSVKHLSDQKMSYPKKFLIKFILGKY